MRAESKINSEIIALRVKAREIARDALLLGLDELSILLQERSEHERSSAYESFWQEVQAQLDKARPPAEPEPEREGSLADNQRSHGKTMRETRHGGTVIAETDLAILALFSNGVECWLPKSQIDECCITPSREFDCLFLPEWLLAEKGIDWIDDDDE